MKMNITKFIFILIIPVLTMFGCGESSAHYTSSDNRFYNSEKPLLAVSSDHYGGGIQISETKKLFPYGLEIENLSTLAIAESVKLRIRIYENNRIIDDEIIDIGDIRPMKKTEIEGSFEVPKAYSGFAVILTYQVDSEIIKIDLKQNNYFLEDSENLNYFINKFSTR